jgi:hypothetical protein
MRVLRSPRIYATEKSHRIDPQDIAELPSHRGEEGKTACIDLVPACWGISLGWLSVGEQPTTKTLTVFNVSPASGTNAIAFKQGPLEPKSRLSPCCENTT